MGLQFKLQLMVGLTLSYSPCLLVQPSKSPKTLEFLFQAEMKMAVIQTAAVVVGLPYLEIFFKKVKLGVEDTLCSQCGEWGSHWWNPLT